MTIKQLMSVVPPPARPRHTGRPARKWQDIQEAFGTTLPSDLRDFGLHYGSGRFIGGYLSVYNPFDPYYVKEIRFECGTLRMIKDSTHSDVPYDIFPDKPGLFPWGTDENGQRMCWLTEGPPDKWPTILMTHIGRLERWDISMTSYLAKQLCNKITSILWDELPPIPRSDRVFTPDKPYPQKKRAGKKKVAKKKAGKKSKKKKPAVKKSPPKTKKNPIKKRKKKK